MKVLFAGSTGTPRLTLVDTPSSYKDCERLAEQAMGSLGSRYWWVGIFDDDDRLIVESTVKRNITLDWKSPPNE